MLSARCVSRPDAKSIKKKCERWQKIALQAAMQSRRGIIPQVCDCVSFEKSAQMSLESEKQIIFYELGGEKVNKILDKKPKSIAMFIGSEGGFEQSEHRDTPLRSLPSRSANLRICAKPKIHVY